METDLCGITLAPAGSPSEALYFLLMFSSANVDDKPFFPYFIWEKGKGTIPNTHTKKTNRRRFLTALNVFLVIR